jgi:hypothetical protein
MKTVKVKFKDAPVGARFKYPNTKIVCVKINSNPKSIDDDGKGLICSWNGPNTIRQNYWAFSHNEVNVDYDTEIDIY